MALAYYAERIVWPTVPADTSDHTSETNTRLEQVESAVDSVMESIRSIVEIQKATQKTSEAAQNMVREVMKKLDGDFKKVQEGLTSLATKFDETPRTQATISSTQTTLAPSIAYADAIRVRQEPVLQREQQRARQILVEGVSREAGNGELLNEQELVTKANLALDRIGRDGSPSQDLKFISVKILERGGLLYELNQADGATWLQKPAVKAAFMKEYAPTGAVMKARTYMLVFDAVPTRFDPEHEAYRKEFQEWNSEVASKVLEMRWMKGVERRRAGQARAAMFVMLSDIDAANWTIDRGLLFCGQRVYGRKWRPEPKRCLKCHKLDAGHLAADCKAITTVCGTCGEVNADHSTSSCPETDRNKRTCQNCRRTGHASWDKDCPAFLEAQRRMLHRNPDLLYRHFPKMSDPSTWSRLDEYHPHVDYENSWASRRPQRVMDGPGTNPRDAHTWRYHPDSRYYSKDTYQQWDAAMGNNSLPPP